MKVYSFPGLGDSAPAHLVCHEIKINDISAPHRLSPQAQGILAEHARADFLGQPITTICQPIGIPGADVAYFAGNINAPGGGFCHYLVVAGDFTDINAVIAINNAITDFLKTKPNHECVAEYQDVIKALLKNNAYIKPVVNEVLKYLSDNYDTVPEGDVKLIEWPVQHVNSLSNKDQAECYHENMDFIAELQGNGFTSGSFNIIRIAEAKIIAEMDGKIENPNMESPLFDALEDVRFVLPNDYEVEDEYEEGITYCLVLKKA